MPKRPFPTIPGAYMVPEPTLSAGHRAAILETLPINEPDKADDAIAEAAEILGELQADLARVPEVQEATEQLAALAEAAGSTHRALGELSSTARALLREQSQRGTPDFDLSAISRVAFWLSIWARDKSEEIRPGTGRPIAWPERSAVVKLATLWERTTAQNAAWLNRENNGGPFARFVRAVSPDLSHRQIETALRLRKSAV